MMPIKFRRKLGSDTRLKNASPDPSDFKENLTKIFYRVILSIGIFSLFSYFFHIEYFPSFDFQSATSYLLSLAYVLTLITLSFSMILLAPYIMAASFIRAKLKKKGNLKIVTKSFNGCFLEFFRSVP